jgi:hypothetical protein
MPKDLSAIESCRRLGITLDALYRLIYAGRLPSPKGRPRLARLLSRSGGPL